MPNAQPPKPILPDKASTIRADQLPHINDRVYWDNIAAWAARFSDGCSGVADIYVRACWEHDYHYRYARTLKGAPISRQVADQRLRDVIQALSPAHRISVVSWVRWLGVRAFGWWAWNGHRAAER